MVLALLVGNPEVSARDGSAIGSDKLVQIEPMTEEMDQVSEPVGELTQPAEDIQTESLDQDAEPVGRLSEQVSDDIAQPESLNEISETDDQASEEIGALSETAEQDSENLPGAPEGEESGLEEETQAEKPLGVREAEGGAIE